MRGFRLVSAKMRALATLSAYVLNSAPGVIWLRRFSNLRMGVLELFDQVEVGNRDSLDFSRSSDGSYASSMSCSYARMQRGQIRRRMAYVSRRFDRATHDNNFFDFQECFGVLGGSNSEIGQRSHCYDGDCVWFIIPENLQHNLMSWLQ
jgi:hypothetical protein